MFIPSLSQVINRNPLTVTPETPVEEAIELMSSTGASYVLVVEPRGNSQFGNPTNGTSPQSRQQSGFYNARCRTAKFDRRCFERICHRANHDQNRNSSPRIGNPRLFCLSKPAGEK